MVTNTTKQPAFITHPIPNKIRNIHSKRMLMLLKFESISTNTEKFSESIFYFQSSLSSRQCKYVQNIDLVNIVNEIWDVSWVRSPLLEMCFNSVSPRNLPVTGEIEGFNASIHVFSSNMQSLSMGGEKIKVGKMPKSNFRDFNPNCVNAFTVKVDEWILAHMTRFIISVLEMNF